MVVASESTETRTDEQVQQDVLAELEFDPRVQATELGVAVKDGIVTLTGRVDAYSKKWAAEESAHRVKGVKAVVNEIEVLLPLSAERSDTDTAAAVVHALEWDAFVDLDTLDVTVSRGWVTLRGEVDWQFQKDDAEKVARRIQGVQGVTNVIAVKQRLTPEDLERRIVEALVRTAETDAQRLTIEIEGSTVILKGTVLSWTEKQEAERVAWSVPGVTQVENDIRIS